MNLEEKINGEILNYAANPLNLYKISKEEYKDISHLLEERFRRV